MPGRTWTDSIRRPGPRRRVSTGVNWWRVETTFCVAAVRTENGRIVETAPIFQRWIGRELWALCRAYNTAAQPMNPVEAEEAARV